MVVMVVVAMIQELELMVVVELVLVVETVVLEPVWMVVVGVGSSVSGGSGGAGGGRVRTCKIALAGTKLTSEGVARVPPAPKATRSPNLAYPTDLNLPHLT